MSGLSGLGGIADLLKNAREMGQQLRQMREQLKSESFTASVAGELVKATVSGEGELLEVEIDASIVSVDEKEMLEDLVVAAVNEATKKSREHARKQLSAVTGGIDVAGILGLS